MMLNAATRRCCLHHARAVQRRVVVNPMESHGCSFGKQRSISSSSQQYLKSPERVFDPKYWKQDRRGVVTLGMNIVLRFPKRLFLVIAHFC